MYIFCFNYEFFENLFILNLFTYLKNYFSRWFNYYQDDGHMYMLVHMCLIGD